MPCTRRVNRNEHGRAGPRGGREASPRIGSAYVQLYGRYWSVEIAAASGVDVMRPLVFIQSP
jgi:hypothetical protein